MSDNDITACWNLLPTKTFSAEFWLLLFFKEKKTQQQQQQQQRKKEKKLGH